MMKHAGFVGFCLTMTALSIYFLVTAPPPLEALEAGARATVPIERVFDTVNGINARARQIYTKEIVGAGKRVGLKFDEEWQEERVLAGPLPALFLRETAAQLERSPLPLGLFLGSDYPINPSNKFSIEQLARFQQLRADGLPRYGEVEGEGTIFGMYADLASAEACVSCHNEHKDTPKDDWQLGDTMGATTWTYPRRMVSADEYVALVDALYQAIGASYELYLAEVAGFEQPPVIGERWPRDGFFLPSGQVFISAVRQATAAEALAALASDLTPRSVAARTAPDAEAPSAGSAAPRSSIAAVASPAVEIIPATFRKSEARQEAAAAASNPAADPPAAVASPPVAALPDDLQLTVAAESVCIAGAGSVELCFSPTHQTCAVSVRRRPN